MILLIITLWVLAGLLAGGILTLRDLNKGVDYSLNDVLASLLISVVLGPVLMLMVFGNKIVLKGKK